jgi:hypothetical protein
MIKPILFNTDMVKAILEGQKTVTRRIVNCKVLNSMLAMGVTDEFILNPENYMPMPKYQIDDVIWVRETWKRYKKAVGSGSDWHVKEFIAYAADGNSGKPSEFYEANWKPSIHMPKSAARLFLKVTGVRVERLQEITDKQAKSEGVKVVTNNSRVMHIAKFIKLWNSTVKKQDADKYGWNANPFVWVIEFERCEKPDEFEGA